MDQEDHNCMCVIHVKPYITPGETLGVAPSWTKHELELAHQRATMLSSSVQSARQRARPNNLTPVAGMKTSGSLQV